MSKGLIALWLCCFGIAAAAAGDLVEEGLRALRSGDLAAAAEHLQAAVEADPDDPRAWLGLAYLRRARQDADGADEAARRAAETASTRPAMLQATADYHAESGDLARAAELEARYLEVRPDDVEGYFRAATFYWRGGDPEAAIRYARQGLERSPEGRFHDLLGKALVDAGRFDEAAQAFDEAIRLEPYVEDFHYDRGYARLRAQQFDAALAAFEKSREIFDKSARIELGVGIAYYGLRRFEAAIEAFLKAARLTPDAPQPHFFLGRMLPNAGDRIAEILAVQRRYHERQPEFYLSSFVLAQALLASQPPAGDPAIEAEAERLLKQSIEINDEFWEARFELGVLLDRQGEYAAAEEQLERAAELSPGASKILYRLARVYARQGKSALAAETRERHARATEAERQAMRAAGGVPPPMGP